MLNSVRLRLKIYRYFVSSAGECGASLPNEYANYGAGYRRLGAVPNRDVRWLAGRTSREKKRRPPVPVTAADRRTPTIGAQTFTGNDAAGPFVIGRTLPRALYDVTAGSLTADLREPHGVAVVIIVRVCRALQGVRTATTTALVI